MADKSLFEKSGYETPKSFFAKVQKSLSADFGDLSEVNKNKGGNP